jgi:hypothetical protein
MTKTVPANPCGGVLVVMVKAIPTGRSDDRTQSAETGEPWSQVGVAPLVLTVITGARKTCHGTVFVLKTRVASARRGKIPAARWCAIAALGTVCMRINGQGAVSFSWVEKRSHSKHQDRKSE